MLLLSMPSWSQSQVALLDFSGNISGELHHFIIVKKFLSELWKDPAYKEEKVN